MRWPIRALRKKYGRRIARAVSTFVKRSYIIVDEFWDIAPQLLLDKYLAHRRYGANVVHATQNLGQLAATAGSKELG
ncbi:TraD/TraG TraM recognition site domain-containing protein OS=Eoetvoesiella caeni OX=645616 GN=DFR37_1267 PE=4 SV=1 [Eoetvoesiella caeni]|uniref:Uncharacterized protein n=1 Tax=Eoetvoesiella caeni TaxID=645616 RepID=A0A366GXZ2_9BURK|nr:hypothetical protein DFR37_1267 [Eoetvoesiella caeni]